MERKISIQLYMLAFIIAAILFSAGVYVGTLINQNVMNYLGSNINELNSRVSSNGVLLLLEGNNSAFCPLYKNELLAIDKEREKFGYELSLMEEQKGYSSPEIKRDYMMLQAQSFLFAKKVKALCKESDFSFVLFFYNNKNCTDCKAQGEAILKARDSASNKEKIRIYAFDTGIESPVVDALMNQYNVKVIPTTIINDVSYHGLLSISNIKMAMEDVDRN